LGSTCSCSKAIKESKVNSAYKAENMIRILGSIWTRSLWERLQSSYNIYQPEQLLMYLKGKQTIESWMHFEEACYPATYNYFKIKMQWYSWKLILKSKY
jgi:hypothetical protein